MLWDDFARLGSPDVSGPAAQGLSFGRAAFPPALTLALARAGVHIEEAPDLAALERAMAAGTQDFVIIHDASLGPDSVDLLDRLSRERGHRIRPVILLRGDRHAPDARAVPAGCAEVLSAGQDPLGCFLMIRATLRRKRPQALADVMRYGALSLDQERITFSLGDVAAPLNMLELCVLGAMLDAPRMVWNKEFLNRVVFGPVDLKPGRHFHAYMSRVRRGLRRKAGVDPIMSERGLGYALSPSVLGVPPIGPAPGI